MPRIARFIILILLLIANTALGIRPADAVVLCIESDGHIAFESRFAQEACCAREPPASTPINDSLSISAACCQDIPVGTDSTVKSARHSQLSLSFAPPILIFASVSASYDFAGRESVSSAMPGGGMLVSLRNIVILA